MPGAGGFDGARMTFRGPPIGDAERYILFLGGSETYGKFVTQPFPDLVHRQLDLPVLNMGAMNAGLDALINDPAVARAVSRADAVVLQVPGAAALTNRFYSVHPYRNDRFLRVSGEFNRRAPDLDLTDIHYVRHLLSRIHGFSDSVYADVIEALRNRWVERMQWLLRGIDAPVHLLWVSARGAATRAPLRDLTADPLFVGPKMLKAVCSQAESLTEVTIPARRLRKSIRGMTCDPTEAHLARALPGPGFHFRTASALLPQLSPRT